MNGTGNVTQQDIQTSSLFVGNEIVETTTTTEAQRNVSPIQSNSTTLKLKKKSNVTTIIQSTVNSSVAQKYSQMDYQTFRSVTKPSYKQQTSHRNIVAEHKYNYVNGPKTTKPKTNTQIFAQNLNIPQPTLNTVNFLDQPQSSQEQSEKYPFFQQNNHTSKYNTKNQPHYYPQSYFASDDEGNYKQNHQRFYSNKKSSSYNLEQPNFFEPYTRNEQIRQPRNNPTFHNNNFQQQNPVNTIIPTNSNAKQNPTAILFTKTRNNKRPTNKFSQMPHAAESLEMTMNPYLMGESLVTSNKPLMVFTGSDPEYSVKD